jgi:hypothetical protein
MFAKIFSCSFVVTASLCAPQSTIAQFNGIGNQEPPPYFQPVPPLPPHLGEWYHHDSTAAGNFLRGQASVMHANGSYLLSLSQSAILWEIARSQDLLNRQKWIDFRAAHSTRLAAERQRSLDARREKNEATRRERYSAAYRLSSWQLDRTSGAIAWPTALLADEYAGGRSRLDEMFREGASSAGSRCQHRTEIMQCVDRLRSQVRRNIGKLDRDDFAAAQKFLCGLTYEAEFETAGWEADGLAYRQPE